MVGRCDTYLKTFLIMILVIITYRVTQVLSDPQEKPALWAPRVCQENQEQKVSEDSQDQWSVEILSSFVFFMPPLDIMIFLKQQVP